MVISIIISKKDIAGMNIRKRLLELFSFKETNESFDNNPIYEFINENNSIIKLYTINEDTVFSENIDEKIDADLFVFATRHKSESGKPCLSMHTPGNWSKADFGGSDRKLCVASASYLKEAFLELSELGKGLPFDICNEVTHHGPFLQKPCFFIEIGSSEEQWNNKEAAEAISKTIMNVLSKERKKYRIAFCIGGPHYCETFNKVVLRTDIAIGHICPKYMLAKLDEESIKQAIERTDEKVDFILLDWKGLGKEKQRIVETLERLGLEYKRTDQLLWKDSSP